jgi:hypothetical protein
MRISRLLRQATEQLVHGAEQETDLSTHAAA